MILPTVFIAGIAVVVIGALTLIGWAFGLPELAGWKAGTVPMAPATALMAVALGGAIAADASMRRLVAAVPNLAVAIVASALLFLRLGGWYLPVERLGFSIAGSLNGAPIGYTSPVSAVAFGLTAVALGLRTAVAIPERIRSMVTLVAALAVGGMGLTFMLATLFGTPVLAGHTTIPVALNTSLVVLLLGTSLGALAAALPDRAANTHRPADRLRQAMTALFVAVVLASVVGGYAFYRHEEQEIVSVYASPAALNHELWSRVLEVLAFVGLLILAVGATLALVWRNQRALHYRQKAALAEALRVQATRVADLVNRSPTILYTLRQSGDQFVASAVSENVERILGYTVAESLEPGWWFAHLVAEDRDEAARAMDQLMHEDEVTHEFRFARKDGSVLWIRDRMNVTRRESGRPVEIIGAWHDISAQREAQMQLRESEKSARLQAAALAAAANAIVITNRDGDIEWVNPAFSRLTGFSADEAIGVNPRALLRSGDQDRAFYERMWNTILSGRVWEGELRNRRKDGSVYYEWQTITPVTDADGAITHFIGVKRDLTEEKQLQARFLQAQKMEVVGRLAGGVAHDFNNLLTIINGESEMALADLAPDAPLRESLSGIYEAGQRATRLTAQLLTFSRKQMATPTIISLSAEIAALAPMIERLIGEDITLSVSTGAVNRPDHVLIDKGQFEQVLLNLAVNARDAMPTGGTLSIALQLSPTEAQIRVSDTGTGIAPGIKSRLFEPFFTTKPKGKGTGLGLATVYGVITSAGGRVDVDSEVGRGATFIVTLPLTDSAADDAADLAEPARGTETIVIVEDERDLRKLTARMLRAAGYTVLPMETPEAALEWFRNPRHAVDLLMTDVVMPGLTGPDLAAAVLALRPELPVLFASGYTDEKLSARAMANPDRFIAKPYSAAALTRKVRQVLDAAPAR